MKVPMLAACFLAVLLVVARAPSAESVPCIPTEMSSCAGAIFAGAAPTTLCCSKLHEQQPCFCKYLRNPALRQYIDSDNAKRMVAACHVIIPQC